MSTSIALNPLAALDNLEFPETTHDTPSAESAPVIPSSAGAAIQSSPTSVPSFTERILDAYEVAQTYAAQIVDLEYKDNVINKLQRSNVRGSLVVGVNRLENVTAMLASVRNWKEVVANLKDPAIRVIQGELPDSYSAFTAYASVREIAHKFGSPGLGSIQAKQGYQNDDDYYFCTMLRFPTEFITVQLKTDGGVEHLHQWFAGQEVSSRLHQNDGDIIVRCGVIIPQVDEQHLKKGKRNDQIRQGGRNHRAG